MHKHPLLIALLLATADANAFCGFYVGGAEDALTANATRVVLLREGQRTVLSLQNDYEGPPEDFALVVPVPHVIREGQVKTLDRALFERVDRLSAPRMVAYWEMDPCASHEILTKEFLSRIPAGRSYQSATTQASGVTVEAAFAVGEYDIVVLGARHSAGLERWLIEHDYNIPTGASEALRPYVEAGTKFFVARVDPKKVTFDGNRAVLSPLRVHYDSETFALPIRLGLLNAEGEQDLIVSVLSDSRVEVANRPNVFIETNRILTDAEAADFPATYSRLFDAAREGKPGAVVTEYAWTATSCDPCPTPPLSQRELLTLGVDVLEPQSRAKRHVLTRLHLRYAPDDAGEDLVFGRVRPVVGGRGTPTAAGTLTEQGVRDNPINAFQARYVQLHPWNGEVSCEAPIRGRWGAPRRTTVAASPLDSPPTPPGPELDVEVPSGGCSALAQSPSFLAPLALLALRRRPRQSRR